MLSIQRLYSNQAIKTTSIESQQAGGGKGLISKDECLAIISKVESKFIIGSAVLSSQIALIKSYDKLLEAALIQMALASGCGDDLAMAMTKCAISEVCGPGVCPRCKGTGVFKSVKLGIVECSKCGGHGGYVPSGRALHKAIIDQLPGTKKISRDTFNRKWSATYLSLVEKLHVESNEAAKMAAEIIRLIYREAGQS